MEREISIILKVKGAKEAKKAVEDVFSQQTTTLVKGFNDATKKTGDNMGRVRNKTKAADSTMKVFTRTLGRGMAAIYLYNRAWNLFGTQFESGLQLERAATQFDRHVGSVTKMLPELRSATQGVVADFDLLKTANRAFQQGIKPQNMASTFKLATSAAQKLGLSTTDAIGTITNALTKQDEGALNTLGIVTSVNQAYKTQTALIAKQGGVMSKAMSIQLRQSLIMKELRSRFGGVNQAQEDGLMVLERFKASWTNFRAVIGQTLGIALIPLTKALTGVLDLTTRLLEKLNQTEGFQKFVQLSATLAGIWAGVKFVGAIRGLLNLFGMISGKGTAKLPTTLSRINVGMGRFGKIVRGIVPGLSKLEGGIAKTIPGLAGVARLIPGWGTALSLILTFLGPVVNLLGKAWTAGKVFFQLLSNFDENTGLSKVLKKDADELGNFYYVMETMAKVALVAWAVIKGIGQGLADGFRPAIAMWDLASDTVSNLANSLFGLAKTEPVSGNYLDAITEKVRKLVKWIGLGVSAIAMFIPGLQVAGAVGVAGFGGALLNDAGLGSALQGAAGSVGDRFGQSQPVTAQPQGQTSTQQSAPAPRSMNIDNGDETPTWARTMIKELQGQTNIMETDSQKQEIEKSQRSAQDKIWTRR